MIKDVVLMGAVNRRPALAWGLLAMFVVGLCVVAAQVAAPFIYTLF